MHELLLSVAPPRVRAAAAEVDRLELALMDGEDETTQLRYAGALAEYADAGGYDAEVLWDACCTAASGCSFDRARFRDVGTLSGGEQKRLVLEALLRGPDEVLLLDEPDNFLDVPGKRWLEGRLAESAKTVLFVSHDRELLANTATRVVTVELRAGGNGVWVHRGGFASYHEARRDRFTRLEELRRRWDEDHAKLRALVLMYKQKAAYNAGHGQPLPRGGHPAGQVRGGRPAGDRAARSSRSRCGCAVGAPACARWSASELELTGLMRPFDLEVWFGERVAVLGSNGSGKSHFLRLLAAGGSDPDVGHRPPLPVAPVSLPDRRASAPGCVRAGSRRPTEHPELLGRTLLEILHRGDGHRAGLPREQAARALDRYELAGAGEQTVRDAVGWPAGAVPDPAAGAVRRDPAAARRADRQPRRAVGGGAGGGPRAVRGHGARGDPRPLVRPRLRPVPGVRRRTARCTSRTEPVWDEGRVTRTR